MTISFLKFNSLKQKYIQPFLDVNYGFSSDILVFFYFLPLIQCSNGRF